MVEALALIWRYFFAAGASVTMFNGLTYAVGKRLRAAATLSRSPREIAALDREHMPGHERGGVGA
jgi:hypothetical protein